MSFFGTSQACRLYARLKLGVVVGLIMHSCVLPGIAAATIDPGLIAHWDLDEGSGTLATDASGHNNGGTIFNGGTYVPGHTGTAVQLNGVNQYIQNTTAINTMGTVDEPYALSAWVKVDAGTTQGNIVHISNQSNGSGWCIPFLYLSGGHFGATSWTHVGANTATSAATVVPGTWYQVMTTWDATNGLRLFVDGVLADASNQTEFNASGSPMYVSFGLGNGACSNNQGYLAGAVDDLRIYARALTPSDVQSIATPDDNDGVPAATEDAAPNAGDANGDGTPDSQQANVSSYVDGVSGHYATLAAPNACSVTSATSNAASHNATADALYQYPLGMMDFTLQCGTNGYAAQITQYYYGADTAKTYVLRKYLPATHGYTTIPATIATQQIGGQTALKVTYTITDGGPYDADGSANGIIVDPAGLGQAVFGVPNTGLGALSRR